MGSECSAVKCPYCGDAATRVLEKREAEDSESNRRRRECGACGKRFTTFERVEAVELMVVKKDGRREQFLPEKLRRGILKACEKRPVSLKDVDRVVEEIEAELRTGAASEEVSAQAVGEKVMEKLRQLDPVAYIRFASVYKQFKGIDEFEEELARLREGA